MEKCLDGKIRLHRSGDVGFEYCDYTLIELKDGSYVVREVCHPHGMPHRKEAFPVTPDQAEWLLEEGQKEGLGYRDAFNLFYGLARRWAKAARG